LRAIEAQRSHDWSKAGFERELSEDITKRVGREPKGFYVPDIGWGQRTVTYTGVGATGSNIVPEDYRGDSFIDALISVSILGSVGATTLNGLQGDVAIPKMTTSSAAAFIDETGASDTMPNNEPAFGQVTMSPKTLANRIAVSRRLMIQTDPSVEQLVRNNMVREFAAKIDRVALDGSGSSSEPTGILNTNGIGAVLAGGDAGNDPLTYGDVVNIWTEVSADNALLGSLNWVTHPRVVGKLMQTLVASSTDSRMIMENTERILGYNVAQTTQMPGAGDGSVTPYALLFGNFSDLLVGFFSALDILVDPYHAAANATTNLYFYQDIDIAVARVESFSASQNVTV
jgi:HK97 family phage major capsid protein